MTIDLTKITTPFGLLDKETQEALKAHGGPYERYYDTTLWLPANPPLWSSATVYRVKPQPRKPREWWGWGDNWGCLVSRPFLDRSDAMVNAPTTTHPTFLTRFIEWPENAPLPSWPEDEK